MTFFDLLNKAGTETREQKQVIVYKADGNGVKVVNKVLINLATLFNRDSIKGMYADYSDRDGAVLYKDFSPCWEVQAICNDTEAGNMEIALIRYNQAMHTYEDFCDMIQNRIDGGSYIKNDALMVLQLHGSIELLQRAKAAKQAIIDEQKRAEAEEAKRRAEEARQQAEADRMEKERIKTEKMAFLEGFAEGKTDIQMERIYTILSKTQGYNIGNKTVYLSRKDFILQTLNNGGRIEQKDGVVSYYGSKWNRKECKPKTEYRLYVDTNSFYTITKTEYDFAVYVMGKREIA